MAAESSGISNKILWWVVTTLTALATGAYTTSTVSTSRTLNDHTARIAAVETQTINDGKQLDRIDRNILHILERLPERRP